MAHVHNMNKSEYSRIGLVRPFSTTLKKINSPKVEFNKFLNFLGGKNLTFSNNFK
jgi:hypothetical protein